VPEKAKVLFLGASPLDQEKLDVERELKNVAESIRSSCFSGRMELVPCLAAEPLDLLGKLIDEKPEILHFSGHGEDTGHLAFQDRAGNSKYASAASLKRLFTVLKGHVRIVFLNACYSEVQAKAISQSIDFTIGMNDEIGDQAAITFAQMFYKSIASGDSVREAYDAGILSLDLEGIPEEGVPQLLSGKYANPDQEFLRNPEESERLTRRTIEIRPPNGLTPGDGCSYGLRMVREGLDDDDRPLINETKWFIEHGDALGCDVEYHDRWGLQFKCFVDLPSIPESLAHLPREWVNAEQVGRRVWFLLDDERYEKYGTKTYYTNNYLPYAPPLSPPPVSTKRRTGRTRRSGQTESEPEMSEATTPEYRTPRGVGPHLTSDLVEFIESLHAGDILLLDSLHPLSGLIQFAENRPVSHAALYLGPGNSSADFAQVTRHTRTQPAARTGSLRARLRGSPGPYDRTITALRHTDVASGTVDPNAILARVERYVDPANTKYAYFSLVKLMPPSLFRSYEHYFASGRIAMRGLGSLLTLMSKYLLAIFDPGNADPDMQFRAGKQTLTCSEFVYRCYKEAGAEIEVDGPLNRWKAATRATRAVGDAGVADTLGVIDGVNVIQFHESLTSAISVPAVRTSRTRAVGDATELQDLALRSAELTRSLIAHNTELSKYSADDGGVPLRSGTRRRAGGPFRSVAPRSVVADSVTPRDLWSSPSLKVCSVLHRPPCADSDSRLDFPH
jgi:hypothetical protein